MKHLDVKSSAFVDGNRNTVKEFLMDQEGGITPFILIAFLTMVLVSGMAVDFMRHEMARADLQNALDRGVLAAADVDQVLPTIANGSGSEEGPDTVGFGDGAFDDDDLTDTQDASSDGDGAPFQSGGGGNTSLTETEVATRELILDYMKSRSYQSPVLNIDVSSPQITGGRRVTASANYNLNTFFLNMMGIDTLSVPAIAQAQDNAGNLEVSLILDVSDSMSAASTATLEAGATRLTDLQKAARQFVDDVLTDDNRDRTAISIIPYSAQVNLSDEMADAYTISGHHSYGNCVNFSADDYTRTDISTLTTLQQSEHFYDYWSSRYYWTRDFLRYERVWTRYGYRWRAVYGPYYQKEVKVPSNYLCPQTTNQIVPYSNDNNKLKTAIDNLDYEGWTASYTGVKWGVAMLDPTARPVVQELINSGDVPAEFSGWPSDWSDPNTQKVVILMTDGRNTRQYDFRNDRYATQSPAYWNENLAPDGWLKLNVDNRNDGGKGDTYLSQICTAAKQHSNTIVFTVAFELDDTADGLAAKAALNDCASSVATEYDTNGHNIDIAFANIAASIKKLRLTQ